MFMFMNKFMNNVLGIEYWLLIRFSVVMSEKNGVVVLAIAAIILVGIILVALCINPWVATGLPAVLLAIAAVLRVIAGNDNDNGAGDGRS